MTQFVVTVILFLVLLAMVPLALRWARQRALGGAADGSGGRVVSALAVGPQQRVVTVEIGPQGRRVWLVLGVTAQAVTCLHTFPVGADTGQEPPPGGV